MKNNIILATDSYKLNHWNQYPKDTERVYSYLESRGGAKFPYTVFVGLQAILKEYMEGQVVKYQDLSEARALAHAHFGNNHLFNYEGWAHIIEDHGGRLPLSIKAVPEGTPVATGNVLMTVENTCDKCFWLTNAMESLLTHVWYPSTVATLSRTTKEMIASYLDLTAGSRAGLEFMLHDFGYRGASSHETAAIGGLGHLVNFVGTDTLPAMLMAIDAYKADLNTLAYSVPATEHSVMTARGREGEMEVVSQLLDEYPTGILSVVADSYDIYNFVDQIGTQFKDRILAREGVFVVRPDSTTPDHTTPEALTANLVGRLFSRFGGEVNTQGYRVLNPRVRVLWGDGINPDGIQKILRELEMRGFSAENMVFGMGGGLLQKVNRDTQRFAFKCSANRRDGMWHDVYKEPLDASKNSKRGRLMLVDLGKGLTTTTLNDAHKDELVEVFRDGKILTTYTFDEVRENAALKEPVTA